MIIGWKLEAASELVKVNWLNLSNKAHRQAYQVATLLKTRDDATLIIAYFFFNFKDVAATHTHVLWRPGVGMVYGVVPTLQAPATWASTCRAYRASWLSTHTQIMFCAAGIAMKWVQM